VLLVAILIYSLFFTFWYNFYRALLQLIDLHFPDHPTATANANRRQTKSEVGPMPPPSRRASSFFDFDLGSLSDSVRGKGAADLWRGMIESRSSAAGATKSERETRGASLFGLKFLGSLFSEAWTRDGPLDHTHYAPPVWQSGLASSRSCFGRRSASGKMSSVAVEGHIISHPHRHAIKRFRQAHKRVLVARRLDRLAILPSAQPHSHMRHLLQLSEWKRVGYTRESASRLLNLPFLVVVIDWCRVPSLATLEEVTNIILFFCRYERPCHFQSPFIGQCFFLAIGYGKTAC
jgi:hypothetical protein